MRCLALAEELRIRGREPTFIHRELPGHLMDRIIEDGFPLRVLPPPKGAAPPVPSPAHATWLGVPMQQDAKETAAIIRSEVSVGDLLVVDHYGIDSRWEAQLAEVVSQILVIDDIEDRPHQCDLLLNQNLRLGPELVPEGVGMALRGPSFALLRREFREARARQRNRTGKIERLLVFFGGTDPENETEKALTGILPVVPESMKFDVVVGAMNPWAPAIAALASRYPAQIRLLSRVKGMADILTAADLAIGAAGTSTWERACLGLPSISTAIAGNQVEIAAAAQAAGITVNLGAAQATTPASYANAFKDLLQHPERLVRMGKAGSALVDGLGTMRVVGLLCDAADDLDTVR